MMSKYSLISLLVALQISSASAPLSAQNTKRGSSPKAEAPSEDKAYDPFRFVVSTRDRIDTYRKRIEKAPRNSADLTMLAYLYVRDARERDVGESYTKAEQTLKRALELDPASPSALYVRTLIHSAHHRFRESLELAKKTYEKHPKAHQFLMVIGDAQLELGEVDRAEKTYQQLQKKSPRTYLDSRRARLAFVRGKPEKALEWMGRALKGEMFTASTKEHRAWYLMRMGELYFEVGNLKQAEAYLGESSELNPNYPATMGLLAQIRIAQGRTKEAIELYEKGLAIHSDLGLLEGLGDLHTSLGNHAQAKRCYDRFVTEASADSDAHGLAEFYCNHDRDLPEALKLTIEDLRHRKSVHAWDAYAWALYKNGKFEEAAVAMEKARRWGTREADLFYHAGMIALALKKPNEGKNLLRQALEMNPSFSLSGARQARKVIEQLEGSE